MAIRIGMAEATLLAKHLCRLLTRYRPAMSAAIATAVSGSVITSGQAATLNAWLDGAQAACDILRLITHY